VCCLRGRMKRVAFFSLSVLVAHAPAFAQDVRGLENCTAEKQMERRTGCLQSNVEFLQQELRKTALESRQKLTAAEKDLAAADKEIALAHKEIAALKGALDKMQSRLDELQKAKKDGK
jgi:septal ring factor EnvC (AmiA/AmiB activator)